MESVRRLGLVTVNSLVIFGAAAGPRIFVIFCPLHEHNPMDMWVRLKERKKNTELRELLGLKPVSLVIKGAD